MNLRRPSDPTLARQMQTWWPEFAEARRAPHRPDSATPERLREIAELRGRATEDRRLRAKAKAAARAAAQAEKAEAVSARDAAMLRVLKTFKRPDQ